MAQTIFELSQGAWDGTVNPLVDLWGFHSDEFTTLIPPSPADIETLLAQAPSVEDITLENGQISSSNPAVQYDLGAFAKGYAIDRGIEIGHVFKLGTKYSESFGAQYLDDEDRKSVV